MDNQEIRDGTLKPVVASSGSTSFNVEHSMVLATGTFRSAIKVSDFPRISTLNNLFASVVLTGIAAEVRQNAFVGNDAGDITAGGHIFTALIPTNRDTDAMSGATNIIVASVPNKQTFPLSSVHQNNIVFQFNLDGYELDLAQDPRRGAGPVAWMGNTGVAKTASSATKVNICTVTWRISVTCSGTTPNW